MKEFLFKVLIFSSIWLYSTSVVAQQTNDTIQHPNYPANTVCMSAINSAGNKWIVFGYDCDSIALLKTDHLVNITNRLHLPAGIVFTCILPLDANTVLLGTEKNYIYMLRHRRFVRLDKAYGLADSTILSMGIDHGSKSLYVSTPMRRYRLQHGSSKRDFYFSEVSPRTTKTNNVDKMSRFFRRPLQKAFCDVFSDIDLSFRSHKYIDDPDIDSIRRQLQPGDILIKRNDHQVSNVAITGFWTHSGIYLGSANQMDTFFKDIPMLNGQKASDYLRENFPNAMTKITENESFIIEAVGEGVIVSPLHHIAGVDYFAALRPELPTEEIFRSLLTALSFYGAPYDFLFDFATDDAVVCSELVCKAYSETPDKKGLIFKSFNRDAPFFYYPNDFARQCCEEASAENKSFNLILFYDAGKNAGSAFDGFCHTLQRHSLF